MSDQSSQPVPLRHDFRYKDDSTCRHWTIALYKENEPVPKWVRVLFAIHTADRSKMRESYSFFFGFRQWWICCSSMNVVLTKTGLEVRRD